MTPGGVWRASLIILWLLVCLVGWTVASLLGRGPYWVRLFLFHTGRILGLRISHDGLVVPKHVLYVANHISWLDILVLGGSTDTRFIAKSEIARWGLIGWLARIAGTVFVSRERRSETRAQADAVTVALGEDQPVAMFAEGSTGDGAAVAPFKPSLFAAAVEADAQVQPLAIDYGPGRSDYAWPRELRFAAEMKRILNRGGRIPVTLRFLPPFDATTLDRKALASLSHAAVAAALT